jgi:polyketide biosynthesis acyl carrier protein
MPEEEDAVHREEVLRLLVKNLKLTIPEFAGEDLDTSKSYKELGVSSLELVRIVSLSMKEMGVKISPALLASVKTTDDLVNVFMQAKGA